MPRKRTITFAVSAFDDLEEIGAWYKDQQVPEVGDRLIKEIISKIGKYLCNYIYSGRLRGTRFFET